MSRILAYTSPARGHVYPIVPTLQELARRGHEIHVRCLESEVRHLQAQGFQASAISPGLEALPLKDWQAASPPEALGICLRTFAERAPIEIEDLQRNIQDTRPDALFIDINTWGAAAAAEASGLPWTAFAPYFLPFRGDGVPPWGFGLAPAAGPDIAARDAILWSMMEGLFSQALPLINPIRLQAGARLYRHPFDYINVPSRLVYFTAEPFEYSRPSWPLHVHRVGPGIWEPPMMEGLPFAESNRPLVLVTCSTEFQNDSSLARNAIEALSSMDMDVVVTTGATGFEAANLPGNILVVPFASHRAILERAACVVCHGGMGITQKALAAGVPVCVVPFGRDQFEVAGHVVSARVGTMLPAPMLTAGALRSAVQSAMTNCCDNARLVAKAFADAGGAPSAADILERSISTAATSPEIRP